MGVSRSLSERFDSKTTPLDDVLQGSYRDWFAPVVGNDNHATVGMSLLLMATLLVDENKAVLAQDTDDLFGIADGKPLSH
jgi:hypothetical protein